jgi:putative PIN family toxin of toxin-antitoxin system
MGKKKSKIKVVLDTNVLVSALLFKKETAKIVDLWKSGKIIPIFSKETFDEFKRVLEYPKFALTKDEIGHLILEEVLPFFEVIEVKSSIKAICKDPDDHKFISCALSAKARFVVSGDKDLYSLKSFESVRIIRPSDLLDLLA